MRVTEMLVVSLTGFNCRIWFHLGCLGRKVTILARFPSVYLDVCFSMVSFRSYFKLESLSHWYPLGV